MKTIGVIDIGSNTVLYLLASNENGLTVLDEGIAFTRLGKGMGDVGQLNGKSADATITAVAEFAKSARDANVEKIIIVATEAVRRALWGEGFAREIENTVGSKVYVLTPQEEGELVLLVARRSLPLNNDPITVVDVGGGSVQIVYERMSLPPRVDTYPLGCVLLTERFGVGEALDRKALVEYAETELGEIKPAEGGVIITGGTATTAVTVIEEMSEYSPGKLHGNRLAASALTALVNKIAGFTLQQKKGLIGMPHARADIFEAGLLAILTVLKTLGSDKVILSCQGVRFGVAYRYFKGFE